MSNKALLIAISERYRKLHEYDPDIRESGFVRIFDGKPYGWCADMGSPNTERPHAFIVGYNGDVFEAIGGDDYNGAKEWQAL